MGWREQSQSEPQPSSVAAGNLDTGYAWADSATTRGGPVITARWSGAVLLGAGTHPITCSHPQIYYLGQGATLWMESPSQPLLPMRQEPGPATLSQSPMGSHHTTGIPALRPYMGTGDYHPRKMLPPSAEEPRIACPETGSHPSSSTHHCRTQDKPATVHTRPRGGPH